MSKNPYIKFYVGDYIKDTRKLTLDEKGAWTEALWAMHADSQKGTIQGTWEDISLTIGANRPERCKQIFTRLQEKGICEIQILENCASVDCEQVQIINRRMQQAYLVSQSRSKNGSKGAIASQITKGIAITQMDEKRQEFIDETNKYKTDFSQEIITIFLSYWLEPNKSKTKYRYEKETFFDFKKRLDTFVRNSNNNYGKGKTHLGNNTAHNQSGYNETPAKAI